MHSRIARRSITLVRGFVTLMKETSPNPASRRFVASDGRKLFPRAAATRDHDDVAVVEINRSRAQATALEPVFQRFEMVQTVLVAQTFVSVTLSEETFDETLWDAIEHELSELLAKEDLHLGNGLPSNEKENQYSQVEEIIIELLETRIKPNLHLDGGDVEYRGFDPETGIVKLRMIGACASCPSSTATMNFGIRNLLTHMIEEVKGVEQVFDDDDIVSDSTNWTG